jgi:thioredoxin/glutathione reductase (selenoprotein)
MSEEYDFDFFVIGGGSGGLAASKAAAALGARVGLADFIQPSPAGTTWGLGGTCVNVGCIPKKLLHIAAQRAEVLREAELFGLAESKPEIVQANWEKVISNINMYIRKLNWKYKADLRDNRVKYYNSFATFEDKNTLLLTDKKGGTERVTSKQILIACGGRPSLGNYPGAEECCISSDDIFWRKTPPGRTLVVGASYIALECAGFIAGLGFDVTVMVRSVLLRGFDSDISDKIGASMERRGVKFEKGMVPSRFEKNLDNGRVRVWGPNNSELYGEFDTVLMAIGRSGFAGRLNLDAAGVDWNSSNGKIRIVKNMEDETNVRGVYALGDVVEGRAELTPPAIFAGKLLAERLFGGSHQVMDYNLVPTTIFTPVEYGCVGLSEEEAPAGCVVYHRFFQPLDESLSLDAPEDECYIKVITEPVDGRVVGVHYLGPHAGEVIQGLAVAVKKGITKTDLDNTVGIHPTNAEWFVSLSLTSVKEDGVELTAGGGC